VDFYLAGHLHYYERTAPVYNNQTIPSALDSPHYHRNPNATIHITSGVAGNRREHNDIISKTP
jgi:hypothetical protein